jgi:hypothetical protein
MCDLLENYYRNQILFYYYKDNKYISPLQTILEIRTSNCK